MAKVKPGEMIEQGRYMGSFRLASADRTPCTLALTMSLADWCELRNQLAGLDAPALWLSQHIRQLINEAEPQFRFAIDKKEG